MKKVITILLIILVLAAGVGFGVYHHKSNETKFNDDYINGNTAGNLYNAGIFCTAADGTIYFANPSDSSKLYSMNSDGSDLTKISVYADRSFSFITKTPPAPVLIKKAAGIDTASGVPNKNKVGSITLAQAEEIAKTKMPDLNAASLEAAVSMIKGTCRSMGVTVEG